MTENQFKEQIKRLIARFGEKHFDPNFTMLVKKSVIDMHEKWLKRLCDTIIGEYSVHRPPLLKDFREPAYHERQSKFNNTLKKVARSPGSLEKVLNDLGASCAMDAVKNEINKNNT